MFYPDEEKNQRAAAADALASCCFYGVTMDEYMQKIDDIYEDYFMKYLLEVILKLNEMKWDFDRIQMFATSHYTSFQEHKVRLLDKLADHFEMNVFCLPPNIRFIDDGKLEDAMKNYSKEEDMALDDKIQKYMEGIHRKRAMIKLLRERIEKIDGIEKSLKALRTNLVSQQ